VLLLFCIRDDNGLRHLFKEILETAVEHSFEEQKALVVVLANLMDGLCDGEPNFRLIVARSFNDAALCHSAPAEAGFLRITSALLDIAQIEAPAEHGSANPSPQRTERESDELPRSLDDRLLGKIKYRWVAASFTYEGQEARREWIAKFRPPALGQDDKWLTLSGLRELIRRVLQLTPVEVNEYEVAEFFSVIDVDDSGYASFYKLLGLLESETLQRPCTSKKQRRRKAKSAGRVAFTNAPWKPPGPKDKGWHVTQSDRAFAWANSN